MLSEYSRARGSVRGRVSCKSSVLEALRRKAIEKSQSFPSLPAQLPLSLLLALATAPAITQPPDVLITGATGRLGSLLYQQAKADTRIGSVRAFVYNVTKARAALGCQECDPSEGIYVGDVRNPLALNAAANGVDAVLVAVGLTPSDTPAVAKAIEVDGVENTARAIYASRVRPARSCSASSMGATLPSPDPRQGDSRSCSSS